jgi:membrane dipeptidase
MKISVQNKKIGVLLGMEGLSQLKDVNELRHLYDLGFRHASLTWNEVNRYAGGLSSDIDGLTLLGKSLLKEMESLGMIIDLAHANAITFRDILTHTSGPIIISHGNTKVLCNHIRNYTDEQLLQVKDRGGVVGICGIGSFIAEDKEHRTVQTMAKHIDYAVKLLGIDHVGIGFDVCYYLGDSSPNNGVKGFETIADAGNLFEELRKLGYNEEEIHKIKYANFARIVHQILR